MSETKIVSVQFLREVEQQAQTLKAEVGLLKRQLRETTARLDAALRDPARAHNARHEEVVE